MIGAIYLDGGFANAKEFIHRYVLDDPEHMQLFFMIARLSCRRSSRRNTTENWNTSMVAQEGPDHDKRFIMEAKNRR